MLSTKSLALVAIILVATAVGVCLLPEESDAASTDSPTEATVELPDGSTVTGTFQDAIIKAAENDGSTITLNDDVSIVFASKTSWTITNEVKLNLNGNTLDLSSTTYSVNIKSGGSLTIEDTSGGSISTTGSSHMLYCSSNSSLTINGGTVEFSSTSGTARSAVYLLSSSAFEMNGGEIVLKDGASDSRALYANGEVVINGGAITSTTEGTYAIYPGTKPILTIAGGDINGKVDLSKGEVTINGGTFSSVPSLDNVKVGDGHYAVVSGTTGSETMTVSDEEPGSDVVAKIGNIYFTCADGRDHAMSSIGVARDVTIYDAPSDWSYEFHLGTMGEYIVVTMNDCDPSAEVVVTTIDGCKVSKETSGTTTRYTSVLDESSARAMILETNQRFPDIDYAIDAVQSGQTIRLLKDNSLGSWTIDCDVTLDLNDQTLTLTGGSVAITVESGAALTIEDSETGGRIVSNANYTRIISGGDDSSIVLRSGTIECSSSNSKFSVIYHAGLDSSFTMEEGSIILKSAKSGHNALESFSGKCMISGGSISAEATGTYAINTSSYGTITIVSGDITGKINTDKGALITLSGGNYSEVPGLHGITVGDGKYILISESESTETMTLTETEPTEEIVATVGNIYFSNTDGRSDAIAALGIVRLATIYEAPPGWKGAFELKEMNDYIEIKMVDCDQSASMEVTAPIGCTVQITDMGDGITRYTAIVNPKDAGALIVETSTHYPEFDDAWDALVSGQTIRLLEDVTREHAMGVTKDVTIDLNGHTLTLSSQGTSPGLSISSNTLVITDTSESYSLSMNEETFEISYIGGKIVYNDKANLGAMYISGPNGKIVLEKGMIESTKQSGVTMASGLFQMDGGYVKATGNAVSLLGGGKGTYCEFVMNGGILEANGGSGIGGNGSAQPTEPGQIPYGYTTCTINGGTIYANSPGFSVGIYHPQFGTLDINGGKIISKNGAGIVIRAGNLTVDNCTIITTGTGTGTAGDSDRVIQPSPIVADTAAGYPMASEGYKAEINSGTFQADEGVPAVVDTVNETGDGSREPVLSIQSGSFSSNVAEYCSDGRTTQSDGAGDGFVIVDTPDVVVNVTADPTEVLGSGEVTISATVTGIPEGEDANYSWTVNGEALAQSEASFTTTVNETSVFTYTATLTGYGNGEEFSGSATVTVTVPVNVTFTLDDATLDTIQLEPGSTVTEFPELPEVKEGYGYIWVDPNGDVWKSDTKVEKDIVLDAMLTITDVKVRLNMNLDTEGATYTATILTSVDYVDSTIVWIDGDKQIESSAFRPSVPGDYSVYVAIIDTNDVIGYAIEEFSYDGSVQPNPDHDRPSIDTGSDDDFIPLPPVTVTEQKQSSDDETVKVVACAAAAVVATLVAAFLVMVYRKD